MHSGRGVWIASDAALDFSTQLAADRLVLPGDAAASHLTGLRLHGLPIADGPFRHWTTTSAAQTALGDIQLHRRASLGCVTAIGGIRVLAAARCLADVAPSVSLLWLVCAGDALVHRGATSHAQLTAVAATRIHGARLLRRAIKLMRTGAESFRESGARLMMLCGGLPEPELNQQIRDEGGEFVSRSDCQGPLSSARGRSWELPGDGHEICPVVAMGSAPRLATIRPGVSSMGSPLDR